MVRANLSSLSLVAAFLGMIHAATGVEPDRSWWPQFRGPLGGGTSATARPPIRIGPAQGVLWKVAVPWSPSSPAVWDETIFLTTFHEGRLETRAHERRTGRLLWSRGVKPDQLELFHRTDGSPAASTPATDGKHVVSYFGSFGLVCYDFDGKELWRRPLPVALSGGSYGSGTSPVIAGNRVLLNRDQDANSSLLAVDLESGRTAWETPRPGAVGGFATPVLWNNAGVNEVVIAGSVRVKGYDLGTGMERWVSTGTSAFVCTTPVVGDSMLFVASWSPGKADTGFSLDWASFLPGFDKNGDGKVTADDFDPVGWEFTRGLDLDRDGSITAADLERFKAHSARAENALLAIRPGGLGEITETHLAWKNARGLPYVASPLYYDGRVYLIKDGGMVSSFDAKTGNAIYLQERLDAVGNYYASPVAADGRIYLASVSGTVSVVKAGGEKPEVLHQAVFGERIFATPAPVEDRLYLRTQNHLYAFGTESGR